MAIHGVGQPASRRPSGTEAVLRRNQLLTYPFPIASRESAVARDAPMAACEPMGHLFLRPEKFEGKVSKFGILFPQAAPGSECHAIPFGRDGFHLCIKFGVDLQFGIHMKIVRPPALEFARTPEGDAWRVVGTARTACVECNAGLACPWLSRRVRNRGGTLRSRASM